MAGWITFAWGLALLLGVPLAAIIYVIRRLR
jgi:hypothetical protein